MNPLADTLSTSAGRLARPQGCGYAPDVRGREGVAHAQASTVPR